MTTPLALLLYDELLPGSQLVNRLQDLGYRTHVLADAGALVEQAERAKPMIVVADLRSRKSDVCAAIQGLKANPATAHVPLIAFADARNRELPQKAHEAGATLVVTDVTIMMHLPQFLEQALALE
jgi:CheY-like chemotaxis protein